MLLLLLPCVAQAEGFRAGVWGARGAVSASKVNAFLVDSFGTVRSSYSVGQATSAGLDVCSIAGVDAGYEFFPGLVVGARLGRLTLAPGTVTGTVTDPATGRSGEFRTRLDGTLTPYLVGGTLRLVESGRWEFLGSLYLGYVDGSLGYAQEDTLGTPGSEFSTTLTGSGIADDFGFELRYRLSRVLQVGLSLHLINLRISQMQPTDDIPAAGISSGDPVRDRDRKAVSFDFNTVAAGAGVEFLF